MSWRTTPAETKPTAREIQARIVNQVGGIRCPFLRACHRSQQRCQASLSGHLHGVRSSGGVIAHDLSLSRSDPGHHRRRRRHVPFDAIGIPQNREAAGSEAPALDGRALGDDVGDALLRVLLPGHGRVLQWGGIAWRPRSGALLRCHLSDQLPVTEDTSRAPEEPDTAADSPPRGTRLPRPCRRAPQRGRCPRVRTRNTTTRTVRLFSRRGDLDFLSGRSLASPSGGPDRRSAGGQAPRARKRHPSGRLDRRRPSGVATETAEEVHPVLMETADYWLSLGLAIGTEHAEAAARLLHLIEAEEPERAELTTDAQHFVGEAMG